MRLNDLRTYANGKIVLAIGLLVITSSAISIYSVREALLLGDNIKTVHENNEIKNELSSLIRALTQQESSVRGYIIAGEPRYLEPYRAVQGELDAQLAKLSSTARNKSYQPDIVAVIPSVQRRAGLLNQIIDVYHGQGPSAAAELVRRGQGETAMSEVRAKVTIANEALDRNLVSSRASADQHTRNTLIVLLVGLPLSAALGVVVYLLFIRTITREREVDQARDEFVSLAAHQLRTPAAGIKAILAMTLAEDFGEISSRQRFFLDKAYASNERSLCLVNDMLEVARLDAGRFELRLNNFDLREVVREAVIEQRQSIEAKRQKLLINQPDEPVEVVADQAKLNMVVGNLLDNASKYTHEQGEISVSILSSDDGVRLHVKDNGVGIKDTDLPEVFDRFKRLDNDLADEAGGSGLGLYLVKRLVELHNGRINVISRVGRGTSFVVELPYEQSPQS